MIDRALPLAVAVLPVLVFLGCLIILDSFKLVRLSTVIWTVLAGAAVALLCYVLNTLLLTRVGLDSVTLTRSIGPVIEETVKAAILIFLLRGNKVGFMVDAGIRGFAIGTGFAIVENLHYINMRPDAHLFIWVIRGFGTAMMHGGATALVGVTSKALLDRTDRWKLRIALPGLLIAILLHVAYNHFFMSPLASTAFILIALPLVTLLVFRRSEESTREWLGSGFDVDRELLAMITSGTVAENRIGQYLNTLRDRFPAETVADMLCLLRVRSELAIKAKGVLLMKEAGFRVPPDPEAAGQMEELKFLQKSVGPTGLLALRPVLGSRGRDLWQLELLSNE